MKQEDRVAFTKFLEQIISSREVSLAIAPDAESLAELVEFVSARGLTRCENAFDIVRTMRQDTWFSLRLRLIFRSFFMISLFSIQQAWFSLAILKLWLKLSRTLRGRTMLCWFLQRRKRWRQHKQKASYCWRVLECAGSRSHERTSYRRAPSNYECRH